MWVEDVKYLEDCCSLSVGWSMVNSGVRVIVCADLGKNSGERETVVLVYEVVRDVLYLRRELVDVYNDS